MCVCALKDYFFDHWCAIVERMKLMYKRQLKCDISQPGIEFYLGTTRMVASTVRVTTVSIIQCH